VKPKLIIIIAVLFFVVLSAFVLEENPYFKITIKDVVFKIPKGFPKPIYDLSKNKPTPEGFTLGRKLFYDPILSVDYFTSCATCHQQFAAFAHIDHPLSHGIGGKVGMRNVPALQNLIWKDAFMADGAINHLDLQPLAPITSVSEMGENLPNVIKKLQANSTYKQMFYKAFKDSVITTEMLMKSFSQFLSLMISSNSRYDKFIAGVDTFTSIEEKGLNLFKSNCVICHSPPLFTDNKYYNIGLKPDSNLNDKGRMTITSFKEDYFKFKTPSLRNVEMTYPYMHDGRYRNLKEVMNHYAASQSCSNKKFDDSEKTELIAFLKTLTDMDYLHDRRFADPNTY
jgi:cytochrome c peroxidase